MSIFFEELAHRNTAIGVVSLRRRRELQLGVDVLEIKLGDEFLMSSLFTVSEVALAQFGIAALSAAGRDIVVGGLGLGYTANAVLEHPAVSSLLVVEMLDAVIDWHRDGLLPWAPVCWPTHAVVLCMVIFLRWPQRPLVLIHKHRVVVLMPFCSTSITHRLRCSTRAAALFTSPLGCANWPPI
jgi:hypothetical protein